MIRIGPRLWKTGLAVAVTVFLVRLSGNPYSVYGAVAAAMAVEPTASISLRTGGAQTVGALLGGLLGYISVLIFGSAPLAMGATVVVVLVVCQQMKWRDVSIAAATVTIFVMDPHADGAAAYAIYRLLSVVIGSLVGAGVNAFILPPDYGPMAMQSILRAGERLDSFILGVADRLTEPESYSKTEILADVATVDEVLKEAQRFHHLMKDSRRLGGQRVVTERAIKVLYSLLERMQLVHMAALTAVAAPDYPQQVGEVQTGLRTLVRLRRELYDRLGRQVSGKPIVAELAALEAEFEGPIGLPVDPRQVGTFYRLLKMRISISYIANRLIRLEVAMEGTDSAPEREQAGQPVTARLP